MQRRPVEHFECILILSGLREKLECRSYLLHPARKGALPGVLLLQVQVRVEEDEINVALQILQAPQQELMALLLRLAALDLEGKRHQKRRGSFKAFLTNTPGVVWTLDKFIQSRDLRV